MTCNSPILASVFTGRDNVISLVLVADGTVLSDLSAVTRVTVTVDAGDTVIDSDIVGGNVIWWTDTKQYRGQTVDVLSLQLGDQGITAGTYGHVVETLPNGNTSVVFNDDVQIVVYDSTYTDGLRVENQLIVTVKA